MCFLKFFGDIGSLPLKLDVMCVAFSCPSCGDVLDDASHVRTKGAGSPRAPRSTARLGFPRRPTVDHWAKDKKLARSTYNARSETGTSR